MAITFTFSVHSLLSDTAEARANARRELERIMREAVLYFTAAEVKALLKKITKRPKQGRPPQARINKLLLDEYDVVVREAAPKRPNKAAFARGFWKKYRPHVNSPEAVEKRLDRLLSRRDKGQN
jgi:hypothetical protein